MSERSSSSDSKGSENSQENLRRSTTGNIKDYRNLKKIANIEDHYEILEKVGEGGFATVSKAKDIHTGKICAIKKMVKKQGGEVNEKAKEAIVNEL